MTRPLENGGVEEQWVPVEPGLFPYPLAQGEKPALLANRCTRCQKVFFPKRRLCPACLATDLEETRLEGRGGIYSATVVHIASPAGIRAPYAYGYVDMATEDIRLFALFTGDRPDTFFSGRDVELTLGPVAVDSLGREVIGYQFRPVLETNGSADDRRL
jgi:uncharacterized OB-fold protein